MTTVERIEEVRKSMVSVYSGKAGKCCCGCAGKHYYRSSKVAEGAAARGYKVAAEDVNDRMVTKVSNIVFKAAQETPHLVETDSNNWSTTIGQRLYIVYF